VTLRFWETIGFPWLLLSQIGISGLIGERLAPLLPDDERVGLVALPAVADRKGWRLDTPARRLPHFALEMRERDP
jgi:hypothetical protein